MSERRRVSRTLGPGREFRHTTNIEIRSGSSRGDGPMVVSGLALRYDATYTVHDMFGSFNETMRRGCCDKVLASSDLDVRFLFNHDGMPLARSTVPAGEIGSLTLNADGDGLDIEAVLNPEMQLARDLMAAIESRLVTQMSVGMVVGTDEWDASYQSRDIYSLSDILDASAVTYPASPTTAIDAAKRSLMSLPIESRARFRPLWTAARDELRAGKQMRDEERALLMEALETLQLADDFEAHPAEVVDELEPIAETVPFDPTLQRQALQAEIEQMQLRSKRRRIS